MTRCPTAWGLVEKVRYARACSPQASVSRRPSNTQYSCTYPMPEAVKPRRLPGKNCRNTLSIIKVDVPHLFFELWVFQQAPAQV